MEFSLKPLSTQLKNEAQQAFDAFLTPPKKSLSQSEQVLLAKANAFSIPFGAIDINAFSWGTGPTVLLVHGWGGHGLQLGNFVQPLLNQGYRVLTFDAPAHGQTARIQTNGFEMARAIATVVDHQAPIESVIAHSLGAASTALAFSWGMQAHNVVFLGAMCWLSNAVTTFSRRARLSSDAETVMRQLFEMHFGKDVWSRFSVENTASKLSMPALLFHDRNDREVALEESKAIAQVWSGARLIETAGLGHRRILRNQSVIRQAVDFIVQDLTVQNLIV